MIITERKEGQKYAIALEGRLDATTAPAFEEVFQRLNPIVMEFVLDLSALSYISSLGLRAILTLFKKMKARGGRLSVVNISDKVRPIFEMSGFIDTFVRDEKLVIIEKGRDGDALEYALQGTLDSLEESNLEPCLTRIKKEEGIRLALLDCAGLVEITPDGCRSLQSLKEGLAAKKRFLHLKNVSEPLARRIEELGFGSLLV
ncbi:MAG: STAS domain-containing protein [Spirochaetaceae bacterium]|jgi:anti-anti-sigma factor|nr:STAS domain-containing protein [Spirochaetaceae bacterium]